VYAAFSRNSDEKQDKATGSKKAGKVLYRQRLLSGSTSYIPQKGTIHSLIDVERLNHMVEYVIEGEGWLCTDVTVRSLEATNILDYRVTFGKKNTLCAAILTEENSVCDTCIVRLFFNYLLLILLFNLLLILLSNLMLILLSNLLSILLLILLSNLLSNLLTNFLFILFW
jgi:hypothetical protein